MDPSHQVNALLGVEIRDVEPADYELLAQLRNYSLSEPITAQTLIDRDAAWTGQGVRHRRAACADGCIVAYAQVVHWQGMMAGAFYEAIDVDPDWLGKGLGSMLVRVDEQFVRSQSGHLIITAARDDRPRSVAFYRNRGYVEHQHLVDSVCDLGEACLLPSRNSEVQILSWTEIGDSDENRRKLHWLHNESDKDTPGAEVWGQTSYELFAGEFFNSKHDPDAIFVAVLDGKWVGVSAIAETEDGHFGTHYTGVLLEARGQNIGYELKRRAVAYAHGKGGLKLRTQNDVRNVPMRRINERFGFKPEFGWIYLRKEVQPGA